jgi:hypothetical protein
MGIVGKWIVIIGDASFIGSTLAGHLDGFTQLFFNNRILETFQYANASLDDD